MNPHNSCSSKRRLLGAAVLPRCPAFPASPFPGLLCVAPHQHFCAVPQPVDPGAHHPTLKGCLCVPLLPFSRKVLISFPISIPGCSFLSCLILPSLFLLSLLFLPLFLLPFPKSHPFFPLLNSFSLASTRAFPMDFPMSGFLLLSPGLHPSYSSISPPRLSLPPPFCPI